MARRLVATGYRVHEVELTGRVVRLRCYSAPSQAFSFYSLRLDIDYGL